MDDKRSNNKLKRTVRELEGHQNEQSLKRKRDEPHKGQRTQTQDEPLQRCIDEHADTHAGGNASDVVCSEQNDFDDSGAKHMD